MKRRGKN
jgi:hypothetical protein